MIGFAPPPCRCVALHKTEKQKVEKLQEQHDVAIELLRVNSTIQVSM